MTDPAKIAIVPYSEPHHDAVAALVLGIQNDEFGDKITYEQQPDLVNPGDFFADRGGGFWVALHEGAVVGTCGLIDAGSRCAGLRKMFVRADMRGAPHAIAQRLLGLAHDFARSRGFLWIYLDTIDEFRAAQRFYARSGYQEIGKAELPPGFPTLPGASKFFRIKL
jgi:GNAT superfamily N-acetyltransferase